MTIHGMTVPTPETGWPTIPIQHYRIWDMGVTWRHINIAPGVYDWTRLDLIVNEFIARGGVNLTYVIAGTPQWCAKDPTLPNYAPWIGPGSNSQPIDNTHFQAFCIAIAQRYLGRISSYQIWNEPQLKDFWGYDNWDALAEMTRIANNAIHGVSASLKTISGPVLPRMSSGGMTRGGKYLTALKAKNWPVDIYSAHIYPEIGYTPGRWRQFAKDWQDKLTELAAPKKAKWVTETNMNLFGGPLTDAAIIDYMNRIDAICTDESIFKCYWYCWQHSDPMLLGIPFSPTSSGTSTLLTLLS